MRTIRVLIYAALLAGAAFASLHRAPKTAIVADDPVPGCGLFPFCAK